MHDDVNPQQRSFEMNYSCTTVRYKDSGALVCESLQQGVLPTCCTAQVYTIEDRG